MTAFHSQQPKSDDGEVNPNGIKWGRRVEGSLLPQREGAWPNKATKLRGQHQYPAFRFSFFIFRIIIHSELPWRQARAVA